MPVQGLFSIGGIASGLDTEGMIESLLALERQPIQRLEQRKDELEGDLDAWSQVTTKLSSVRGAVDGLDRLADFDAMTSVRSSDRDAVGITATGPVDDQSFEVTVDQLAARMQQAAGDTFDGLDAQIGDREVVLTTTVDGEDVVHDVTGDLPADATLGDLVDEINERDLGVQATALQVEPGAYRLVLDAEASGTTGAFQVNADLADDGWDDGFTVTQDAADAQLRVGGVEVTRSSNTIDDLIDGVELELRSTTDDPVTITAERDVDAAVDALRGFVQATNGALDTIADLSDYDPETEVAGPLQGDPSLARLATELRNAVSYPIDGLEGSDALASDLGISLTRDGRIDFDEARARAALEDDFDGTAARLARSASTTHDNAIFEGATSATQPGTYEVEVTQVAGEDGDVEGRIRLVGQQEWVEATGNGSLLRAPDGPAEGLLLDVDGVAEGGTFEVSYTRGLMGQVGEALSRAEGSDGLIERARNAIDRQSELYDDRIEAFERRVESRERTIRQQFVAMERALSQFNEQSSQLQQQLAQLG